MSYHIELDPGGFRSPELASQADAHEAFHNAIDTFGKAEGVEIRLMKGPTMISAYRGLEYHHGRP